jgi:hypothetical protein
MALAVLVLATGCSAAGAMHGDSADAEEAIATYEAALAPLKKRSDVLEQKFAEVQGEGYSGPGQVRDVLVEIIPQYADLLEATQAIEVEGADLEKAHELLVASLERQQEGLELALRGMKEDDPTLVRRAGKALQEAQALVERHRDLLADARG